MDKLKILLLAASLVLAITFTFSCSSDDGGGGGGGTCIANFRTVTIGTQTWMAENLNCNVRGSKCYDNNSANCAKYGRLYDWATAMGLPSSCNSSGCSNQIQSKHKGICPSGWHIPSNDDWKVLMDYVGGSETAGTKLKAKIGWNESDNGTDEFEFSALPGGWGYSDGSFSDVGDYGFWWSASEDKEVSKDASSRRMGYNYERMDDWFSSSKPCLFSVRCVKD